MIVTSITHADGTIDTFKCLGKESNFDGRGLMGLSRLVGGDQ